MERLFEIPGWINFIPEDKQEKMEAFHDEYLNTLKKAENYYCKIEKPKILKLIKEFKEENADFAEECKARRLQEVKEMFEIKKTQLEKMLEDREDVAKKEKLLNEVIYLDNVIKSTITQDMIARAEEHPIENIIEVDKRGFARCVNHDDRNPSMYCKNNYAHCFSCGWTGNTIKVLIKKENINFKEAVIRLQ